MLDERPNVVIVLTDDAGYSDVSCYGGEVETTNIDRLAANGIRFRTFYTNAGCSPTRASLLTGQWPQAVGAGDLCRPRDETPYPGYLGYLTPDCDTLAEVLRGAGYRTLMTGKWHLGGERVTEDGEVVEGETAKWPTGRGFERFFGLMHGETGYFTPTDGRPYRLGEAVHAVDEGFYATDAMADFPLRFLDEVRSDGADDPFFLYVPFTAPHTPFAAPAELVAKYRERFEELGPAQTERARYQCLVESGTIPGAWALKSMVHAKTLKKRESSVETESTVAAMIESYDAAVGRVVDKIEQLGELDETLFVFLSDNGAAGRHKTLGNTPFSGRKGPLEEGGLVTHCIVHFPARLEDGDGLTTARGEEPPPAPHRRPMVARRADVLRLQRAAGRDRRGVEAPRRQGRGGAAPRLDSDGCEMRDVAADHPERVAELRAAHAAWAAANHVLPAEKVRSAQKKHGGPAVPW